MPLWSIDPDEKLTILSDWAVFKVYWKDLEQPAIHVAGFAIYNSEGRVSSPVLEVNKELRQFRTRSRVYQLQENYNKSLSTLAGDALYVYTSFIYLNKKYLTKEPEDITHEYI